jgi:hypothetical protein
MAELVVMHTHRHYVPVIRWKRGEQKALLKLTSEVRREITPLIEIVPKQLEGGKRIEEAAKQIAPGMERISTRRFSPAAKRSSSKRNSTIQQGGSEVQHAIRAQHWTTAISCLSEVGQRFYPTDGLPAVLTTLQARLSPIEP